MSKYLFVILLGTLVLGPLNAQTKRAYIEAAEKAYAEKNYYGALTYFNNVFEFDEKDPQIVFKAAESARQFNAYARAAEKYQFLLDTLKDTGYPMATYWLAEMNQRMGKYDDADLYYNLYLSEYSDIDSFYTAKAGKELASITYAKQLLESSKKTISIDKLTDDVNTNSSEVGAHSYKDKLYFTSMRYKESLSKSIAPREISKLLKKSKENPAVLIDNDINKRDLLVANSAINHNGTKFYYTVCEYLNGSDIRCDIYSANILSDSILDVEEKLNAPINLPGTTSTHPNIVLDKISGKEILYFVSDRQGGAGKLDIWYSVLDEKYGFSEPINIKEVNTSYDEITPFFHSESNVLFFSTDGREGMGGFDIYKTIKGKDSFTQLMNVGSPLNSSYNDIYYFLEPNSEIAYFSSNREGAYFLDSYFESCCYDIYKADIIKLELDLNALTYDKLTGRSLKGATVRLIDKDSGIEIGTVTNIDGNDHKFPLDEDRNYMIIATRDNYYPDTIFLSTIGAEISESITRKMYLETDMMLLDVYTFTLVGKIPLEGTTVILTDLSDPSVPDVIITNPLENDFYFMLDKGKQYRLTAKKEGYTDAVETVDTRPFDKSGLIRKDLFLDKFVLQDLLPLALYFDNDLPDLRSRSTATKTKYGELVSNYIGRKETYKQKYSQPLKAEDKFTAESLFEEFFEVEVKGSYEKLKLFMISLLQELEAGNKVELVFKGYASPRAESKYNLILGQRRVNSVKNEMIIYGNQELQNYFKSGQLKITDISFGKELAPPDVIDNLYDERNSIYSIKAARERRVEILRASRK
ncbi:MAG: hypothetical protein IPM42_00605 [Saprospiraceae bacterium]|nr:hypothetical protein [Saprospiraceae bacterium]